MGMDFYNAFIAANSGKNRTASEINTIANLGAKNLFLNTAQSGGSAIVRTVNDDGTISFTGAAPSTPTNVYLGDITLDKGKYILSGCPSGGSDSSYRLEVRDESGSTVIAKDYGSGAVITADSTTTYKVQVRFVKDYELNNLLFKPMIRPAEIEDPAYQPYAPTNRELFKMILALQD